MEAAVKYTIEFGGAPQDVTITTSGSGTGKGLVDFVRDLVSSPRFRPGMLILVDHLSLDPTPITAADVRAQAEAVILLNERIGPSKVAIVVPTPLAFGFARMYELHAEPAEVTSKVFYSRSEALEWLESEREPEPVGHADSL
jgi:hypothetical protein